jgi:glutamate-1-semialdehyde 2,1-aminomutase
MELFGSGRVNHSGTYNANLVSISAALATLRALSAEGQPVFNRINAVGKALMDGIAEAATRCGVNLRVSGLPSAFHTCFADHPIHDYTTYMRADHKRLGLFLGELLESGVRPTSRGTWFVSAAHTDDDVTTTLDAVQRSLKSIP